MKTTGIFGMIVALLIAAMSIGLTSCNKEVEEDNKEPEIDLSGATLKGRWYYYFRGTEDSKRYFEFNSNGTYSYVTENETINGNYRITEGEKTTVFNLYTGQFYNRFTQTYLDDVEAVSANVNILFKILASGSNAFDQLRVYQPQQVYHSQQKNVLIQLYLSNEPVQTLGWFVQDY